MTVSMGVHIKQNKYVKALINSKLFFAFMLNLFFFLLVLLFCDMKYEVSDDFVMASILSGSYGDTQNPQMIFVNVLLGYLLLPFYKMVPEVSWYFVMQIVIIFISSTALTYLLLEKLNRAKAIMLSVILILFFSNDAYILVQFTKTAMFAVMSGSSLFLWALFEHKRKRVILFGASLCLIGTLLRFSVIYLAGGFIIFILIYEYILLLKKGKNSNVLIQRSLYIFFVGAMLICSACLAKWLDWYTYNNDELYGNFSAYNKTRSEVVDYPEYGYYAYADELQAVGVTENDYYMMRTWNFADNDMFSLDRMQQVADIIKDYHDNRNMTFEQLLKNIEDRELLKYPACFACILLLILGVFFNHKKWWTMLINWGIGISLLIYFAYRERSIYRIEFSIFLGLFITGIYFWTHRTDVQKELINGSSISSQCCAVIIFICCISNLLLYIPNLSYKEIDTNQRKTYIESTFYESWNYDSSKYRKVVNRDKPPNDLLEEMKDNEQNFYFMDFSTTIQTLYFEWSPWESPPQGYYKNHLYLAGVTSNFPDAVKILEKNNLLNPLKSLINNNIYLVDNSSLELKLNYLREHYYPNARAELYKEVSGYQIWKIYEE